MGLSSGTCPGFKTNTPQFVGRAEVNQHMFIPHGRHIPSRLSENQSKEKLAQYADRVWGITEGSLDERAKIGIEKTVAFFHSLGIKTKLSEYTSDYKGTGAEIARRLTERGMTSLGEHGTLKPEDAEKIVALAY